MAHEKHHMELHCPRDRAKLVEREHEVPGRNVRADHCPKCEGIFLDAHEIKRLTGKRNVNQQITEYLGVDVGSHLVCPNCGGLMDDEHFVGANGKITIDVCLSCQGVWLDKGELEAIATVNDKDYDKLSTEKQAEVFDQDAAAKRRLGGANFLTRALVDAVRAIKSGTRRFR